MNITAIKTRILRAPKDDLLSAILDAVDALPERSVLVVASKVVSIWQGRCVAMDEVRDKDELIKKEAERYLPRGYKGSKRLWTIKENFLTSGAGVDQSNSDGHYILWPEDPMKAAEELWTWLREKYGVKELGVVISDSHPVPLHAGTVGMSLAYWGFVPLRDYRGDEDLFGRKLKFTRRNFPDSLAAATGLAMGEAAESTPLVLVTNIPGIEFSDGPVIPKDKHMRFEISFDEDAYSPFFSSVPWEKGGGERSK